MREEYCQSCNNIIRFPESARKVMCESCDTEWMVVRTGTLVNLAPVGTLQASGQEETLQKKLKELQRQVLIKEDHCRELKNQIDSIVIEFQPVPVPAKLGAAAAMLFFLAGAAGAWFFGQTVVVPVLVGLSLAPIIGVVIYKRQLNAHEREKLLGKKELIQDLGRIKKEIEDVKAEKEQAAQDAVID